MNKQIKLDYGYTKLMDKLKEKTRKNSKCKKVTK